MFVTALPEAHEAAAGALFGLGDAIMGANAGAGAVHWALLPMSSLDPTALALHLLMMGNAVHWQATQIVGSVEHGLFAGTTGLSGLNYGVTEAGTALTLF